MKLKKPQTLSQCDYAAIFILKLAKLFGNYSKANVFI